VRHVSGVRPVSVMLEIRGAPEHEQLISDLNNLYGVLSVSASYLGPDDSDD
jgi:hypothetical protein